MGKVWVVGTEIPANEALSGELDLQDANFIALEMPTTWAGTSITFQAKVERGGTEADNLETWRNVHSEGGGEVTWTVAANRIVVPDGIDADILKGLRFIRVRSGTSGTPVNQNPSKQIRLILKSA